MRRHTHHRAIAVAHEHIVPHPQRNRLASQRMRYRKARIHTGFLFHRQLSLSRTARLAFLNKRRQRRVSQSRMLR